MNGRPSTRSPTSKRIAGTASGPRFTVGANRRTIDFTASGSPARIDATVAAVVARLPHGNVYVNRNMIGAVVGTQPFGGTGLSGTGPKAGGPDTLHRFVTEQTVTINTAAAGGNASLLAEGD